MCLQWSNGKRQRPGFVLGSCSSNFKISHICIFIYIHIYHISYIYIYIYICHTQGYLSIYIYIIHIHGKIYPQLVCFFPGSPRILGESVFIFFRSSRMAWPWISAGSGRRSLRFVCKTDTAPMIHGVNHPGEVKFHHLPSGTLCGFSHTK